MPGETDSSYLNHHVYSSSGVRRYQKVIYDNNTRSEITFLAPPPPFINIFLPPTKTNTNTHRQNSHPRFFLSQTVSSPFSFTFPFTKTILEFTRFIVREIRNVRNVSHVIACISCFPLRAKL